jgi:hypothetical protein
LQRYLLTMELNMHMPSGTLTLGSSVAKCQRQASPPRYSQHALAKPATIGKDQFAERVVVFRWRAP